MVAKGSFCQPAGSWLACVPGIPPRMALISQSRQRLHENGLRKVQCKQASCSLFLAQVKPRLAPLDPLTKKGESDFNKENENLKQGRLLVFEKQGTQKRKRLKTEHQSAAPNTWEPTTTETLVRTFPSFTFELPLQCFLVRLAPGIFEFSIAVLNLVGR